jgi:hypothetical protein
MGIMEKRASGNKARHTARLRRGRTFRRSPSSWRDTRRVSGKESGRPRARLAALGGTVLMDTPAGFGRLIAEDTEKWAKVIKLANVKPE